MERSSLLEKGHSHHYKLTKKGRGKWAILFLCLTTVCYIASLCTPWFWTIREGIDKDTTNCFIDGTCRRGGAVFKDNGDMQKIYDATLILMILGLVPFLSLFHFVLFMYSRRYENYYLWRVLGVVCGILTFLLIFVAVLLFSLGIPANSEYDDFFGNYRDPKTGVLVKWGGNAGWFLAIFTLLFLIPTTFLTCTMKNKKKIDTRAKIVCQTPSTLASH